LPDCDAYLAATDYNRNGTNDGDDFSKFLAVLNGGSALKCDPPKDPQVGPKCP
jgi:hypothetical protein